MSTYGAGNYGSGTYANASTGITPDGINDATAPGDPTITFDAVTPDGIADATTLEDPTATHAATTTPDGIADPAAPDAPALTFTTHVTPDGIADPAAHGDPTTTHTASATPDALAVTVAADPPITTYGPLDPQPEGISEPAVGDPPAVTFTAATAPDEGPADTIAVGDPTAAYLRTPDGLALPTASDAPTATFTATTTPDGADLTVALDGPTAAYLRVPDAATVTIGLGNPSVTTHLTVGPDGIALTLTLDAAATANAATARPDPLGVTLLGDAPTITFRPSNTAAAPKTTYVGEIVATAPQVTGTDDREFRNQPVPILPELAPKLAAHILGIGPHLPFQPWSWLNWPLSNRIAQASRPTMALPAATSKSFTLRLNAGGEARTDHAFERHEAIIIEEMTTDLWWRRRDPNRNVTEGIGRFNADKVDVTSTGTGGVTVSATYVDHRQLLEERLVLAYANTPTANKSAWPKDTAVITIIDFIVPTNLELDRTEIGPASYGNVGLLDEPFELPPGTSVADALRALQAVSSQTWEWWIEMPATDALRPKIRFGTRGRTTSITLFDFAGQGPIEKWSMQRAADKYANALFFSGSEGGVVVRHTGDIAKYGQRDASDSDVSLQGQLALITANAKRRLGELIDRTPSFVLTLRPGFWEGPGHIDVGDWVNVRIELGDDLIAGQHRVTELTAEIDSSGVETVSLTLGPPRASSAARSRASAEAKLWRTLKAYTRQNPGTTTIT